MTRRKSKRATLIIIITAGLLVIGYWLSQQTWENRLVWAIENQDVAKVEHLLTDKGHDVNQPAGGWYPFNLLAENPWNTPLETACEVSNYQIVRALVDYGADATKERKGSFSLTLWTLQRYDDADFIILQTLIEHGATVDQTSLSADIPILVAAGMPVFDNNGNFDQGRAAEIAKIYALLIQHSDFPNPVDESGRNALMFATSADNPDLMSDIIKSGCVNINAVDSQGRTALFYVTKDGYEGDWESMIEILINAGIDRSVSDNQGKTAYDYAVEAGDNDLAEFIKP